MKRVAAASCCEAALHAAQQRFIAARVPLLHIVERSETMLHAVQLHRASYIQKTPRGRLLRGVFVALKDIAQSGAFRRRFPKCITIPSPES
jgi:hypothetical protein